MTWRYFVTSIIPCLRRLRKARRTDSSSERVGLVVENCHVLRDEPVIGDGVVFRAIRSLQREFWQPPRIDNDDGRHSRRQVGEPIA